MSVPRVLHDVAVLRDGRALVVGGWNGTDPLHRYTSAELFTPAAPPPSIFISPPDSVYGFETSVTKLVSPPFNVVMGYNTVTGGGWLASDVDPAMNSVVNWTSHDVLSEWTTQVEGSTSSGLPVTGFGGDPTVAAGPSNSLGSSVLMSVIANTGSKQAPTDIVVGSSMDGGVTFSHRYVVTQPNAPNCPYQGRLGGGVPTAITPDNPYGVTLADEPVMAIDPSYPNDVPGGPLGIGGAEVWFFWALNGTTTDTSIMRKANVLQDGTLRFECANPVHLPPSQDAPKFDLVANASMAIGTAPLGTPQQGQQAAFLAFPAVPKSSPSNDPDAYEVKCEDVDTNLAVGWWVFWTFDSGKTFNNAFLHLPVDNHWPACVLDHGAGSSRANHENRARPALAFEFLSHTLYIAVGRSDTANPNPPTPVRSQIALYASHPFASSVTVGQVLPGPAPVGSSLQDQFGVSLATDIDTMGIAWHESTGTPGDFSVHVRGNIGNIQVNSMDNSLTPSWVSPQGPIVSGPAWQQTCRDYPGSNNVHPCWGEYEGMTNDGLLGYWVGWGSNIDGPNDTRPYLARLPFP